MPPKKKKSTDDNFDSSFEAAKKKVSAKIPTPPSNPPPPLSFKSKRPIPPIGKSNQQVVTKQALSVSDKRLLPEPKGKKANHLLKMFEEAKKETQLLANEYTEQVQESENNENEENKTDEDNEQEAEETSDAEEKEPDQEKEEAEEQETEEAEEQETEEAEEQETEETYYSDANKNEQNSLLQEIQSFNKSKLKKTKIYNEDLDLFGDSEIEGDLNKDPKQKTINQKNLCFDFWDGTSYPVHKLKYIVLQIPAKSWVTLNFSGISHLTDMTFAILSNMRKTEEARLDAVREILLDGCFMITDTGLEWMADTFPNLSLLSLVGCNKVTSSGLLTLSIKCPKLSSMDISGTNVNYLPKRWMNGEGIKMTGAPVLFPMAPDDINSQKHDVLKDDSKNLLKICIIRREKVKMNLLTVLGVEKRNFSPTFIQLKEEISDGNISASVIEFHESLSTYMVTDQSLVIITTQLNDESKLQEEVSSISALILEILGKHTFVNFLILGCASHTIKPIATERIKEEVKKYLQKIIDLIKDTNYSLVNVEKMPFNTQMEFSVARRLQERLSKAAINSLNIHLDQVESQALVKHLCKFAKELHTLDEIKYSKSIYDWAKAFHLKCPEEIQTGIHHLHKAASIIGSSSGFSEKLRSFGAVYFLAGLGKLCIWTNMLGEKLVSNTSWLCNSLNLLLAANPLKITNNGLDHTIADDVLVWPLEILEKEVNNKNLDWDKVQEIFLHFPYTWLKTSTTLTSVCSLPDKSIISINKSSVDETSLNLIYSFVLNQSVTPAIMQDIILHALNIHFPVHVWKNGIIIYDSIVAVMLAQTEYSKVINVSAYMMSSDEQNISSVLIHNTMEKYKTIIEYVLRSAGFFWEFLRVASNEVKAPPENICGVTHGHIFKKQEMGFCKQCGITPKQASLLTQMELSNQPCFLSEDLIKSADFDGQIYGSVIEYTGPCNTKIAAVLDPYGCHQCAILLMQGNVKSLKIYFVSPSLESLIIDLTKKTVQINMPGIEKEINISEHIGNIPLQGETITCKIKHLHPFELEVFLGPKLLATIPMPFNRYELRISSSKPKEDLQNTIITVRENNFKSSTSAIQKEMRLEAVDRKNPHLVCVATIADINPDNGQVLIHFDGWGNNYDYWADPQSEDLHPIGFMAYRGSNLSQLIHLRPELQPPSRYSKPFEWLTYLKEVNADPVPYECFTERQIDTTPQDLILKVQSELGFSSFFARKNSVNQSCQNNPITAQYLEFLTKSHVSKLEEKIHSGEMDQLLENQKNLFCFLPSPLTVQALRFPELSSIFSNQQQNLHFLCPGQNLDVHFVNHKGLSVSVEQFESLKSWANILKTVISLILLQKHVLPSDTSSLIVETHLLTDEKKALLEIAFRRLLRLYLMHCLFFKETQDISSEKANMIQDYLKSAETSEDNDLFQMFAKADGQGSLLCNAHKLANSPSAEIQEFPLAKFQTLGSNIFIIHLENNPLTSLPEEFFDVFCNLNQLWLDGCKIAELPSLRKNKSIEELHLKGNSLQTLPETIKQLTFIKILDISNNPLEILPQIISSLESLVELYADNIGTVDLEIILPLKNLKKLSLAYNFIDFIPEAISALPLTYFDMSGLPLMAKNTSISLPSLNSFLDKYIVYKRLTTKDRADIFEKIENTGEKMSNSAKVTELNKVLFQKYPRLGNLSKQPDLNIPESILKITTLDTLILPYHSFVSVPDTISNLSSLETLIVESNPRLESVSPEVAKLPIKKLHIRECIHLKTPPKEVVRRGFTAIFGYLKRLLQGFVSCKRTKLMMVGLGGAGKTSLVRALTNRQHSFYSDYTERITDGIDITEWLVDVSNVEVENDVDKSSPLHFSVWDFAGQTVYYNTHQFFLSNRAVYLLLWNIRLGYEHAGLDFWLSSIACHAPKAPILVVGTHCDKVKKGKLPVEELRRRFPQIVGFHFVSSYSGEGISDLQSNIIKSALVQTYMGENIPEAWLTLERQLDKLRETKSLLKFKEIEEVANTVGILDNSELVQAVQFLHDLGSVQFFNTPFLKSHVVIVSQWIVDVMACIVTVHEGPIKEGKFYYSDMVTVWEKYPTDLHTWLLRLTEEFDLTFPLSDEEANIVPCLLPNTEPQFDFTPVNKDNNERETKMIYRFEYLPAGLFNRVQVRLHQFSDSSVMWKTGFLLKKNNHRALLRQTSNTEVLVIARGCRPENTLFLVHEVFECLISDSYSGVSYDFSIPCVECNDEIDPCMFPASKIQRAFELKIPFLQCDTNFHIISIPELMSTLPPDPNADFDDHLGRSIRELQELDETLAVRVFFIYSSRNVPDLSMVDKIVNPIHILEDMRNAGYNVSYCDDPEKANMESLTLAIKAAQVIVLGMSDEFIDSKKCKDLIIYIKQTLHKTLILVAIGNTLAWQKTDINLILADEVFIKMTQIERYEIKMQELVEAIKSRRHKKKDNYPECFISYCWANSKTAVDLGSATKEGALGWADPRKIKEFLQSKGVNCWLDVEQMGQEGFFEDIAEGLRKAKVMVACVSDEYAASKNCKMEFRFAISTLKIPAILAVVGNGYSWERSEIGLLTVGHSQFCPKINLQYENEAGLLELLMEVQKFLPKNTEISSLESSRAGSPHQHIAFQEVLELTQRKFLRQITLYSATMDMESYPRLILIDLKTKEDGSKLNDTEINKAQEYPENVDKASSQDPKNMAAQDSTAAYSEEEGKKSKYCFKILCEHELGWHDMPMEISFPSKEVPELEDFLKSVAPYMARIFAVLKYSTLNLPILNTPQGEHIRKKFEEWSTRMTPDFQTEYCSILQAIMEEDEKRSYGGLKKCHMPNGKILWLCDKHEKSSYTVTEEKYKNNFLEEQDHDHKMEEIEDEEIETRPNTVMEAEIITNKNASVSKAVNDKKPEAEEEQESVQKAVKLQSSTGGQILLRRPKLMKRNTSSKRTTSQACLLM